jgi:hypothetical protein
MPATAQSPQPCSKATRSLGAAILRGCVAGAVVAFVLEAGNVLLGANFHTVIPGAVYRCSQPTADRLASMVHKYGIRTVINLRGCCDPEPEYLQECRATFGLDISQEDVGFSSGKLPPVPAVRELVRVLDGSEKPVILHCHKGVDRTGWASALALLLYTDTTPQQARRQLGWRFFHLPYGRTGNMDRFFDLYSEWLAANDLRHSRDTFRRWLERDYCAGECQCSIKLLDPQHDPLPAPRDRPFAVRVRCTNTSVRPWQFRPGNNAGIHAGWMLHDSAGQLVLCGRAGLFERTVPPGDSVDLTLALPSLSSAGRYRLCVDMEDERHARFFQEGSEPLFVELEVP